MNRYQRADLGLISTVLREQRRALYPRLRSHHGRPPTSDATAALVADVQRAIGERHPSDLLGHAAGHGGTSL